MRIALPYLLWGRTATSDIPAILGLEICVGFLEVIFYINYPMIKCGEFKDFIKIQTFHAINIDNRCYRKDPLVSTREI